VVIVVGEVVSVVDAEVGNVGVIAASVVTGNSVVFSIIFGAHALNKPTTIAITIPTRKLRLVINFFLS